MLWGSVLHVEPCAGHPQGAQGLPGGRHLPPASPAAWARSAAVLGPHEVLALPQAAARVGFRVAHIPGDPETMKPWSACLEALQGADSQLLTLVTLKAF